MKILAWIFGFIFGISGLSLLISGEFLSSVLALTIAFLLIRYGLKKKTIEKSADKKESEYTTAKQYIYKKYSIPSFDSFVAIDFETTGLNPKNDKIIEIGAVKFIEGEKVMEFNTFVDPQRKIPKDATRINGITDEMVKGAPNIETAINDLLFFIEDYPIVAHNASFDMGFLLQSSPKEINNPVVDTLQLCRKQFEFENNKLKTVCDNLGINNNEFHRALGDSMATGLVYLKCKKEYDIQNSVDKGRKLEDKGETDKAVKQYEKAIENNFDGNHPYDRLAVYYRKNKDYDNEERVLLKAIYVFENVVYEGRGDRLPKLEKFKDRLEKVYLLKSKAVG